jgi:signal transduction histidine kinase
LSLILMVSVLMTIFFVVLDRYLKANSIQQVEKTIMFLGRNTAQSLQNPLLYSDYSRIENIVYPIILDAVDFLVVYDRGTSNIAFKEDKNNYTFLFQWKDIVSGIMDIKITPLVIKGEEYTQYTFPVFSIGTGDPLGYLIIGVSGKKMRSLMEGITNRVLIASFMLFLALTVTIYFLSDKIVKPIKQLSLNIGTFAAGEYSIRSDIKTSDEIRDLSDNFNFMADKINEQIVSIEKYSKNLEKMVEERTVELLKALDAIKEKDNKLNQAEKINSLNSIVSSIAHEINNPLAIISGNLQLLEPRLQDPLVQKKLNTANEAVQRIANLIDEINFFAAIKDSSTTSLSFGELLTEIIEKIVPPGIEVNREGTEDDHIDTSAHLLTIVMENILENAVEMLSLESNRAVGKILIRYFLDTPYFVIEVIDNAGGFKDTTKVFEPFYTTFSQKKGLGLTFVYHAIQALNGEITVENVEAIGNIGKAESGARVSIMLPIRIDIDDEEQWQP